MVEFAPIGRRTEDFSNHTLTGSALSMTSKFADGTSASQQHSGWTRQLEEASDSIGDERAPQASSRYLAAVDRLYGELHLWCLGDSQGMQCANIAALALDSSQQQSAKTQLVALYRSIREKDSPDGEECDNVAEAWIHAVKARKAILDGDASTVKTHVDEAFDLLSASLASGRKRERKFNRDKARRECVKDFAELVLKRRPPRGWADPSQVAKALGQELVRIIESQSPDRALWKKEPAVLILEWLDKKKGPVFEAYRGRGS
ncbi:hypothetical protein SAMN04487785_1113 [Dyella jiangningensis]|uniref:hypothetical protein n=1 Tax=Dyella sp. AtDHG13 TaxID=1938897 RepID=UPI0008899591|nr:hypothetical protein [Dyella sp. AtDHG13]PXV55445.1 hypothetical protein BDW41_111150 [Dyella sp. AtDHG13]SDK76258.1 hypothetical protein SAMN04487785_1113 [Dyella jiangningensis]